MITRIPTINMSKEQWLEERSHSVGGSEIGAILGLNSFQSAYSLWAERVGLTPAFEGNLQTEFGTFMEEFVAQLFTKKSGLDVRRTNYLYRNDKYPWLHASPDRMIVGMPAGLEIKTTSAWNATKFHGEEFPGQYYAQSVQYMAVLELPVWYIAVLIGNQDFKIYQLTRDTAQPKPDWCVSSLVVEDEEINTLVEAGKDFLYKVENRITPEIDGSDATGEAIKTIWAGEDDGETIVLQGKEALLDEWLALKGQIDALGKRQDAIKNMLCAEIGEHSTGLCGEHKVTWKSQSRTTLDTKKLKTEQPDVYTKYAKTGTARVFKIS